MIEKQVVKEKDLDLIRKYKSGDKGALEELIKNHILFIKGLVNKNTPKHLSHDKDAVEQEGIMGLMQAVERYDEKYNNGLLAYATPWIIGQIQRYIKDNRDIHIPVYVLENLNKINEFKDNFIRDNLREPSNKEIALELGMKEEKVRDLIKNTQNSYSIDYEYDNNVTLGSTLEKTTFENFEHEIELLDLKSIIMSILMNGSFTESEIEIAIYRYGLNGKELTLEEVGKKKGITKERVRQIEEKVLKKLRATENFKKLEIYSSENSFLKKLKYAYNSYLDTKAKYTYYQLNFLMYWISNFGKDEILDIVMINMIKNVENSRKVILKIIDEERNKGSKKVRYFIESVGINIEEL